MTRRYDPEDWARIEALLDGALEREGAERERWLREATADDPDLRAEVENLLLAAEQPGLLDRSLGEVAAGVWEEPEENGAFEGRRVGPWRLVDALGTGGMGRVFRAERAEGGFEQRAALKLLRWELAGPALRERFQRERRILAGLQHPGIARLIDGGVSEEGLPWLAMELVEGRPITTFCEEEELSVRRRLELFLEVVDAVHYAHRNLVVHRDLKPSNILVTPEGRVRLLDFGIAKILDETGVDEALTHTRHGPATPHCAAPEQLAGGAVTTATDVWALGVLLYEVLAGQGPFTQGESTLAAVTRRVLESDPLPPSRIAPAGRRRLVEGDLDVIVAKALRKEPERRYASVERLGEDVRRHLEGLPVSARRPTLAYRARKFISRHRAGVGVTTAAVLVLASVVAFFTVRLAAERSRVKAEAAKTEQVKSFLISLFETNDPTVSGGEDVSAREMLDTGAARIGEELADQPALQAEMQHVMAGLYQELGAYDEAAEHFAEAARLRRSALGPDAVDLALSLSRWGFVLQEMDRLEEAEAKLREAREVAERGEAPPLVLSGILNDLGMTLAYEGEYEEAESLLRRALEMKRSRLEAGDPDMATALSNLGLTVKWKGDFDEAEKLYRQALEIRRRALGPEDPQYALTLDNLGVLLGQRGDYAESERCFREALQVRTKVLGEDHPDVALNLNNLATLYRVQGRLDEALPLYRRVLEMNTRIWGPDHRRVATNLTNLGSLTLAQGDADEAARLFERSLAIRRAKLGDGHVDVANAMDHLVTALLAQGAYARADSLSARALEVVDRAVDPDSIDRAPILRHRARALLERGRPSQARPLLEEALAIEEKILSPDHWQTAATRVVLGRTLAAQRRWDEAEEQLLTADRVLLEERGPDDAETRRARAALVELYEEWGRPEQADPYRVQP